MKIEETNKILSVIYEAYPSFRKDRNPKRTSELWHVYFKNVSYEQAAEALKIYIAMDTKGFPPAQGALLEIISSQMKQEEMTEMEAWNLTCNAISRSTYYSCEEFNKLPPMIQKVVGSPDNLHNWDALDEWSVQNNVAPWFRRAYNSQMERERRTKLIPQGDFLHLMQGN